MAVKQTAGRDQLGEFAPKFAQLNDDVLFGEVWSREEALSLRDRSLVTIVALMSQGLIDSSFEYHLATAKKNGITKTEIAEIVTHAAFYMGWPKAWAVFRMAKEIWTVEGADDKGREEYERTLMFPLGNPNDGFAQYFIGQIIWLLLVSSKYQCLTEHLNQVVVIIGISIMLIRTVGKCSFVLAVVAGIRNGASLLANFILEM